MYGPCYKCNAPGNKECPKCGRPACTKHFNHIQNICKDCASGVGVK